MIPLPHSLVSIATDDGHGVKVLVAPTAPTQSVAGAMHPSVLSLDSDWGAGPSSTVALTRLEMREVVEKLTALSAAEVPTLELRSGGTALRVAYDFHGVTNLDGACIEIVTGGAPHQITRLAHVFLTRHELTGFTTRLAAALSPAPAS